MNLIKNTLINYKKSSAHGILGFMAIVPAIFVAIGHMLDRTTYRRKILFGLIILEV